MLWFYRTMSHSGLVRPPAGVDMFMNDRVQQMEGEAVKTTYCKGSKWQSGTDWEKKDFRVKKIKCLYREEGMWGVKNLFKSSAISVWGDPKEAKKEFTFSVSALWSVISATNSCYSSLWNDGVFLHKFVVFHTMWNYFMKNQTHSHTLNPRLS